MKNFCDKSKIKEEYQKFANEYEQNLKKINDLIEQLLGEVKKGNEENIFNIIRQLNSFPIRYGQFIELKEFILNNIASLPLTKKENFIEFLTFYDKFDLENYEEFFSKILQAYENKINYFSPEELVVLIYSLSKFRIYKKELWTNLLKIISTQTSDLQTQSLTKLFLGLSMLKVSEPDFFPQNSAEEKIFENILVHVAKKASELNSQDVFRVCISLTKKPITLQQVPENLWAKLQEIFTKNLTEYDLYQISQILLLFCETTFVSDSLFTPVESDIISNYFDKITELKSIPEDQINLTSILEDLCKINFSFALTIKGSLNFWNMFFKTCLVLSKFLSISSIESLHFIIYRSVDYFSRHFAYDNLNKNLLDEVYRNMDELSGIIQKKLLEEKLLERNELDPFNMMMPYARMSNTNYKIWNYISTNILTVLSNPKFPMNPFLLSDLTYAFASHNSSLIAENEASIENEKKNSENYVNSFYIQNLQKIWETIENHILQFSAYLDVPYLTNMIVDLSQINVELKKSWSLLVDQIRENMNKGNFDIDNFILVLIGLKRKNYQDKNLWIDVENFMEKNIKKFDIDQLKKITVALVKANDTDAQNIYGLIANRFCDKDIIDCYNFENFVDLQIPFALIGIGNDKIWNKFEEILFKNYDTVKENKPLLLSTLYSFSRLIKGSSLVWNKFAQTLVEKLNEMDIDDLGHVGICLRDNIVKKYNLTKILNEDFWNRFINIVDKDINNASAITCNNLLIVFKENEIIKSNTKITKKIQDRLIAASR